MITPFYAILLWLTSCAFFPLFILLFIFISMPRFVCINNLWLLIHWNLQLDSPIVLIIKFYISNICRFHYLERKIQKVEHTFGWRQCNVWPRFWLNTQLHNAWNLLFQIGFWLHFFLSSKIISYMNCIDESDFFTISDQKLSRSKNQLRKPTNIQFAANALHTWNTDDCLHTCWNENSRKQQMKWNFPTQNTVGNRCAEKRRCLNEYGKKCWWKNLKKNWTKNSFPGNFFASFFAWMMQINMEFEASHPYVAMKNQIILLLEKSSWRV